MPGCNASIKHRTVGKQFYELSYVVFFSFFSNSEFCCQLKRVRVSTIFDDTDQSQESGVGLHVVLGAKDSLSFCSFGYPQTQKREREGVARMCANVENILLHETGSSLLKSLIMPWVSS